jgi:hypothetical protein
MPNEDKSPVYLGPEYKFPPYLGRELFDIVLTLEDLNKLDEAYRYWAYKHLLFDMDEDKLHNKVYDLIKCLTYVPLGLGIVALPCQSKGEEA